MKRPAELIQGLSNLAQSQCTMSLQLRIHKNMCEMWGYQKLAATLACQQSTTGAQLDKVILRLLNLEQAVDLQNLGRLNIGQTVEEIFVSDREMAIDCRAVAHRLCQSLAGDVTTLTLVEGLLFELEERISFQGQQLELVRQMGTQNYLATRC